jgi:alginate O-acetyltransferase complex protein AlgJ
MDVLSVTPSDEIGSVARGQVSAISDDRGLTLRGWVVGDVDPATEIEIADRAGRVIARAPVKMPRPDLRRVIKDPSAMATAGFQVVLEVEGTGADTLLIRVVTTSSPFPLMASIHVKTAVPRPTRRPRFRPFRMLLRRRKVSWSVVRTGLTWSVLSLSGENEKVLLGRADWLFLQGDTNDVIGQHTGRVVLGNERRQAWGRTLTLRRSAAEDRGVIWLCIVIPDKESVYAEYLPVEIDPSARRPVHDFLEVAEQSRAPVVYALSSLEEQKRDRELYPKTDTHWNHRGAYVAYRTICDELLGRGVKLDILEEDSMSWSEECVAGDLGSKMHPGPVLSITSRAHLKSPRAKLVHDNGIQNHGRVWIYERSDYDGATCVVFGESFVENLLPFLKETFRRLVVVHTSLFVSEIVDRERADVVLSFPLERFLIRVPDDDDAFRQLSEMAGSKGGELPWTE